MINAKIVRVNKNVWKVSTKQHYKDTWKPSALAIARTCFDSYQSL